MLHIDGWMDGVITMTLGPIQFAKSSKNLGTKFGEARLGFFELFWMQMETKSEFDAQFILNWRTTRERPLVSNGWTFLFENSTPLNPD